MPHRAGDVCTPAVERLYLLTLALEEALQGEQFPESSALFAERAAILEELSTLTLSDEARECVERIQIVERRIVDFLTRWKTSAVAEFQKGQKGRDATTAYLSQACGFGFSVDGQA